MDITLNKKPKNAIIIEGFPGFGLVGTIATEFLMDHLECEQIGRIWFDKIPAMVAIHENKVVEPIGIFYNKKYNQDFQEFLFLFCHFILSTNHTNFTN